MSHRLSSPLIICAERNSARQGNGGNRAKLLRDKRVREHAQSRTVPRDASDMIYSAPRPPGLKNLGMPWNAGELQQLESLVNTGLPAAHIARIMERSTVAIRAKAAAKGWRLKSRKPPKPSSGGTQS